MELSVSLSKGDCGNSDICTLQVQVETRNYFKTSRLKQLINLLCYRLHHWLPGSSHNFLSSVVVGFKAMKVFLAR
jgi:hypothetical protein